MHPLLKTPKILHLYKEGATFNKVMMLYRFDKKLRLLLFNEIEKIEIAVREAVMNMTAERTGDIYWLTNSAHFRDQSIFVNSMAMLSKEYERSTEDFIVHHRGPPLSKTGNNISISTLQILLKVVTFAQASK